MSCFFMLPTTCCPFWRHVDFFFYQHTRSVQWKWDWFYFLTTALRTRPLKESGSREFRSPLTWMLQQRLRHTPFLSSKLWEGDEIARRTSTSVMFHVERQPWTTAALPNDSLHQKQRLRSLEIKRVANQSIILSKRRTWRINSIKCYKMLGVSRV